MREPDTVCASSATPTDELRCFRRSSHVAVVADMVTVRSRGRGGKPDCAAGSAKAWRSRKTRGRAFLTPSMPAILRTLNPKP